MKKSLIVLLFLLIFTLTSCNKEENTTSKVEEQKQQVVAEIKTETGVKEESKVEIVKNTGSIEKTEVKDLGNNFSINQTEDETILIYSGNNVYSWSHISKENPFIWDEGCEELTKINESSKLQGAELKKVSWDKLGLEGQKKCIKDNLFKNISVEKTVNDRLFLVKRALYESSEIVFFDSKDSKTYKGLDNIDIINKVDFGKDNIFIMFNGARGGQSNLISINTIDNTIKILFDGNDINEMEAKDFEILKDDKIKIIYNFNGKSLEKIVNVK